VVLVVVVQLAVVAAVEVAAVAPAAAKAAVVAVVAAARGFVWCGVCVPWLVSRAFSCAKEWRSLRFHRR
jgi:hypothetical protein